MAKQFQRISKLDVLNPCSNNWDEMSGSERTRFCASCKKEVHNFTKMTNQQIESLLLDANQSICARIDKNSDGTIQTLDSNKRRPANKTLRIALSAILTSLFSFNLTAIAKPVPTTNRLTIKATDDKQPDTNNPVIFGTIYDATRAVVTGAKVKVTDKSNNFEIYTTTDVDGNFSLTLPSAGSYAIEIDANGFKLQYLPDIEIVAGQKIKVEPMLLVEPVSDIVYIEGENTVVVIMGGEISCTVRSYTVKDRLFNAIKYPFKKISKAIARK